MDEVFALNNGLSVYGIFLQSDISLSIVVANVTKSFCWCPTLKLNPLFNSYFYSSVSTLSVRLTIAFSFIFVEFFLDRS